MLSRCFFTVVSLTVSTGLGLSIVKQLVEAEGGKVRADFPAAGGSVFWFEVPIAPGG